MSRLVQVGPDWLMNTAHMKEVSRAGANVTITTFPERGWPNGRPHCLRDDDGSLWKVLCADMELQVRETKA